MPAWRGRARRGSDDECRLGRLRSHEQSLARCRAERFPKSPSSASSISTRTGRRRGRVSTSSTASRSGLTSMPCSTRPSREAVFDVVVPAARREVAFSALAHRCHLLTEKPLADSPENARAIVERARQAGRVHAVVQNRRYRCQCAAHPPLHRFRRDRRANQHSRRFLRRTAFRRLPRGDATTCCCSTWRSTPSTPRATW